MKKPAAKVGGDHPGNGRGLRCRKRRAGRVHQALPNDRWLRRLRPSGLRPCGLQPRKVRRPPQRCRGFSYGKWGCSSVGRAPALQAGGRRFDPVHLHHAIIYERFVRLFRSSSMVERPPVKRMVPGSSPGFGANTRRQPPSFGTSFEALRAVAAAGEGSRFRSSAVEHPVHIGIVGGSNPSGSTSFPGFRRKSRRMATSRPRMRM